MPTGKRRWRRTSGARPDAVPGAGIARPASMPAAARAAISRRNAHGGNLNVFQAAADHLKALQAAGKRVLVASWTDGSAERMGGVLSDHGVTPIRKVADWPEALKLDAARVGHRLSGHRARLRGARLRRAVANRMCWATAWCGRRAARAGRRISSPKPRRWRRAIWSPISSMAWAAIWA